MRDDRGVPVGTILTLLPWSVFLAALFFAAGQLRLAGAPWPREALETGRPLLAAMAAITMAGMVIGASRQKDSGWIHAIGFMAGLSSSTLAATAGLAVARLGTSGGSSAVLLALLAAAGIHGVILAAFHANEMSERAPRAAGEGIVLFWRFSAGYAVICAAFLIVV